MDKNTITGFILIFGILLVWNMTMKPDVDKQLQEQQHIQDSIAQAEKQPTETQAPVAPPTAPTPGEPDSSNLANEQMQLQFKYGAFAPAATGEEQESVLENDKMRIVFSNKGGRIKEVLLKDYSKITFDSSHQEHKLPLKLLEDEKNRFEYLLPVKGAAVGKVKTQDLFFETTKNGNSITFRANAGQGRYFEQVYTLNDSYEMDYSIGFENLGQVLDTPDGTVELKWLDYPDRIEWNYTYEQRYSTVYFKETDEDYDYCSCVQADKEELNSKPIDWMAHSNQFFASILMSDGRPFKGGEFEVEVFNKDELKNSPDLKIFKTSLQVPADNGTFAMQMYLGPKDYKILSEYGREIKYIVPFGRSIIGTANRWVIRPLFNFLSSFIGSKGIVILVLTLIVKLVLYPLTYKMLHSQAKMAALKPRLASLKERFKDDQTQAQMESMKLYREFGVNPLGGCMPIALQMPVWFALYRFFPASIEFRQEPFLWATDLSSYDIFYWLPWEIPFYGQHVSLFTLLWVITTLIYTYYNMQQMEMGNMGGANAKMMKYMQFAMPVFFLFFFNNFASGLTCYLVFSNTFNIAQTLITKNILIDHDKIKADLEAYKKKPKKKKKGGFQARMEEAMKQQKAIAAQREAAKKKKK
ncbi:MAG TPA: membrane protein insertase YidC [Bacteroidetes bacterium]|nr:membrane protein insertase YidC [Bacteroidota bacterium]